MGTAFVAVFSYVTASRFPFAHEAYWAATAAVVTLYSERDATIKAGVQQFFGSAVGGLIGWGSASWGPHNALLYGLAVLVGIALCHVLHVPAAARLCAAAVTIITLIPFHEPPATVAWHRFVEVSYGVACALGYTVAVQCIVGSWRRWRSRLT
jgi:uncharacterized membrane protein YgaE (UPF0421/DUF939 family)